MDKIRIDSLRPIRVARFADADVDRIVFDVSPWRTAYPTLNDYRVEVTAPNGLIYIPVKVELNDDDFIWTITAEDTASVGTGTYQIVGTGENGERKTSASATFVVRSTMPGSADETPSDPAKPWVDKIVEAAQRVEDATVHPPVIGANGNWLLWDFEASAYVDSGKPSQGSGGITQEVDPTAYNLPVLYLNGDKTGISSKNAVQMNYVYGDMSGTCTIKWQGSSSLNYPKKNYTIVFDRAFEAMTGWGEQSKYCLKANYIDHSHARNICSCRLWRSMAAGRADVLALPAFFSGLPNYGAIDGFPIVLMLNDKFRGLYTWNIPKDGWMFGNPKAIVCADNYTDATMFKALATFNGDFKIEYVEDESDTEWVKTSINRMLQAVIDSNGTNLWNTCNQYLSIHSAMDYYIHAADECAKDGIGKNYLLVTWDGTRWFMSPYDRDTTYGIDWDGTMNFPTNTNTTYATIASGHRLFNLIYNYHRAQLKERAIYVRDGLKTEGLVNDTFTSFAAGIPSTLLVEDAKKWPGIPSTNTSNIAQILNWYRLRRKNLDAEIEAWG